MEPRAHPVYKTSETREEGSYDLTLCPWTVSTAWIIWSSVNPKPSIDIRKRIRGKEQIGDDRTGLTHSLTTLQHKMPRSNSTARAHLSSLSNSNFENIV
jgi:hypothetical protein